MKRVFYLIAAAFVFLAISGCSSPYDLGSNWLIRDNDVPQYYSKFDLFYIGKAPDGYGDTHDIQFNWTKTHTNDIFGRGVRVFAPKIQNPDVDNVAEALQYYMNNQFQQDQIMQNHNYTNKNQLNNYLHLFKI